MESNLQSGTHTITCSWDGVALIFQLIASGEIEMVDDGRGHYYNVRAEEITEEEYRKNWEVLKEENNEA